MHASRIIDRVRRHCTENPARQTGFTAIELVLVIVIVGILAAVAGPRFFDSSAFDERAYYDEVVNAVRYAQKVAVASGCRVRVNLAAGSYELRQQTTLAGHCDPADMTFPLPVLLSDGQTFDGVAPPGVSASPPLVIVYDALGRTNLAGDQTVNIGSWSMLIAAESGLVTSP